jgi:Immunoglobulin I-set domain
MTDLNAVSSLPPGWTLTNAAAINDSGYIAATMSNSQTFASHACLLVPTATAAPAITKSPSDQAVATGGTVTLLGIATGTPIPAYQWQTSSDGAVWTSLSDTAQYSGTTTPVLTITPTDVVLNGRKFRVTASNSTGVANSAVATLTVQSAATAPAILSGPADVSVAAGGTATLSAQISGTEPLTYSWQRDASPILGASGPQLVISDVQRTHAASYTVTVSNAAGSVTSAAARVSVLGASPDNLLLGAIKSGTTLTATPAQSVTVWYAGPGAPQWTVTSNQPWIGVGGGSGSGSGVFSVGISNPGDVIGSNTALNGSVTVSAAALGISLVIPVRLTVTQGTGGALPFGALDTPVDNSTGLQGSIAVTGWALDDVGVDHVEIWRDRVAGETTPVFSGAGPGNGKIYIGNAFFVSGARPDVQAAFASYPLGQRAGWGYLLLTWGLWQQGNGPYTLYAFAFDVDGHVATLGSTNITVDNAHANRPFGTIDTPAYGGTASGISWNYGWALTPGQTCTVGGGSVQASIDSGPLVPVTYGDQRSDIASSFAGFTDASAAGGHYLLDTTHLADGVHQIGWLVSDSCGRADGIGSRFFNVANGGSGALTASASRISRTNVVADRLRVVRNGVPYSPALSKTGVAVVPLEQGQRLEVQLPSDVGPYDGVLVAGGSLGALPLGSSFDHQGGRFYWQPAPGFLGAYDLAFTAPVHAITVRVVVGPALRMTVDSPSAGVLPSSRFTVSGWALDLSAADRGIDVVHVWAYPVGGGSPIFAGWASIENERPDVAALYGPTFASSGYTVDASLPAGTYDLVVFAHLVNANAFVANTPVRIVVR